MPPLRHHLLGRLREELPAERRPGVVRDERNNREQRADIDNRGRPHKGEARQFGDVSSQSRLHFLSPKRRDAYQAQKLKMNVMMKSTKPVA